MIRCTPRPYVSRRVATRVIVPCRMVAQETPHTTIPKQSKRYRVPTPPPKTSIPPVNDSLHAPPPKTSIPPMNDSLHAPPPPPPTHIVISDDNPHYHSKVLCKSAFTGAGLVVAGPIGALVGYWLGTAISDD